MQVDSTSSAVSNSQDPLDMTSLTSQTLSQADFLKLLVAQMTSQNPLSPLDNQDLLSQMVQFSTLQGNANLQTTLGNLQSSENLTQASSLLGRQVIVQADANSTTQGIVSGVEVDSGTPRVVVNGTPYDLSAVLWVSTPPANQ